MATDAEKRDAAEQLRAAIEAHARAQCDNENALLLNAIVGMEVAYQHDASDTGLAYRFIYATAPDTCSPAGTLGVAQQAVWALECDIGPPPRQLVSDEDEDE